MVTGSSLLVELISRAANLRNLPVPLVLAVVDQESSFDPWAWNPEPKYRYLWDVTMGRPFRGLTPTENASEVPPKDFFAYRGVPADAEFWGQQASWGLMQVMGAVAREHGFLGRYLSQLCDPSTGLGLGCDVLAGLWKRYDGNPFPALEAYNGGPGAVGKNERYAREVLARVGKFNA